MIRWSTEMGCYQPPFSGGWNTSVSERPVDRAFESHQPHIFFTVSSEQDSLETQLLNNLGAWIWKGAQDVPGYTDHVLVYQRGQQEPLR